MSVVYGKFLDALWDFRMLDGAESVLVGFSGGADSVALLDLLSAYGKENGLSVSAVHVNHGIRGRDADDDESFCKSFCNERQIRFFCVRENVPLSAKKNREGLEEAARRIRYEAFEKIRRDNGIEKVATAHNSSDNLETVIFHLARGSALSGLCGIPASRDNIIRPLIYCSKDEILDYCRERGLDFVTDKTNSDVEYTRNYIRHKIVPELRKINPTVEDAVTRSCRLLRMDKDLLESMAEAHSVSEGREKLSLLPRPILARVIKASAEKFGCNPSAVQIGNAEELVRSKKAHGCVSFSGGFDFVADRDTLYFLKSDRSDRFAKKAKQTGFEITLAPGVNILPENNVIYLDDRSDPLKAGKNIKDLKNIYKLYIQEDLSSDKINGDVFVRNRREGDKYRFNGMTRSVRKLMQSEKSGEKDRKNTPIVCDDDGICFLPGFPPRDGLKPEDGDTAIRIYFFKGENESEKSK